MSLWVTPNLHSSACRKKRRRRAIFVETQRQEFQAPSGATSSEYAVADGGFCFMDFRSTNMPRLWGITLLHSLGRISRRMKHVHRFLQRRQRLGQWIKGRWVCMIHIFAQEPVFCMASTNRSNSRIEACVCRTRPGKSFVPVRQQMQNGVRHPPRLVIIKIVLRETAGVMLVRLVQSRNASNPMVVTLVGIVTLARLVQPLNA